ncbi:MAG: hypothetical protein ILO34_00055, partial [Kiritimatiellae bacterium]|nr:hypothetical protein [Kiritimatiellia bacterium]
AFSAYNILDAVAPKWAWINEVNIYGIHDSRYLNSDADAQFVEIAVPAGADISGWSVRMLEAVTSRRTIVTNTVAVFGAGNLSATKSMDYVQSNMSFRVIGNLNSRKNGKLAFDNGTLDGTWSIPVPTDTFSSSGEIFWTDPIGIQLVRSSGVVEHEIVAIGTNWYGAAMSEYDPANSVETFNSKMRNAAFFYAGADDAMKASAKTGTSYEKRGSSIYGTGASLGVMSSDGETAENWSNSAACTPGSVNEGQIIDQDAIPQPTGEEIVVYCSVDTVGGHIVQTVGDAVETNATQMIMIKRGSEDGTNIVYKVDPWYELGNVSVTSAGKAQSYTSVPVGERTYKVTVGRYASNTVTVVASARVDEKLRNEFGIDDNNAYTPAVMAWLEDGETLKGPFAYPDSGEILLADFIDRNDSVVTNLTLTEMYWLDMDPTVGGLALKGYMARPPEEHAWQGMVNLRMEAFAMITNRLGDAHWPSAWRPYALRGLAPGENSWDFAAPSASWGWTSVTFKVTGFLNTGLTKFGNRDNWIPLRYFVFTDDSFRAEGETAPYTSSIEIVDPFTRSSLAGEYGWYDWVREHGDTQAYYSWTIDTRIKPVNVEVLKKENYYEE